MQKFFRIAEVCARTGLSKATIYRLQAAGEFPRAVRLGLRSVGWLVAELDQWEASRKRTA